MREKGRQLDLTSACTPLPAGHPAAQTEARNRFLGIHFTCCDVYTRIYLNREQTAYLGNCPRCTKRIELKIGSGGTDSRFFKVQ